MDFKRKKKTQAAPTPEEVRAELLRFIEKNQAADVQKGAIVYTLDDRYRAIGIPQGTIGKVLSMQGEALARKHPESATIWAKVRWQGVMIPGSDPPHNVVALPAARLHPWQPTYSEDLEKTDLEGLVSVAATFEKKLPPGARRMFGL